MNMVSVVTGDLVEHGSTAEYEHLRVLLATLVMPFFVIPGNNDSREGMREAFGSEGYLPRAGFLHYAIEQDPLRIVALDTHIPGEHGGLPCAERLAWFDSALAAAPKLPTVVLMHHPAFATGIAHMDRYGLRDTAAFGEIVSRNRQIERILRGHFASRDRPPLCRHGRRDRAEHGPSGLARSRAGGTAAIRFEPPGYQLQLWREGAGLVSHTAVSGDRPGSYPFRAAG